MPRDGSNIYHRPPGTDGVPNYTVESARYNAFTADIEQDLNLPRPVIAGGTGANNAADAMKNLGGELSAQLIVNYNSDPFQAGSFYSAAGATGAPTVNAFTGICYAATITGSVTTDLFIEARDQVTTNLWVRQKKANVWQPWAQAAGVASGPTVPTGVTPNTLWWDPTRGKLFIYYQDADSSQWVEAVAVPDVDVNTFVEVAGDNMTGPLILSADPTLPLGAVTKQYADAGDAAALAAAATAALNLMRSYLAGLTLSTPGASINFTVQPGVAMNSTNAAMMTLAAALTKTTAAWAVGSGGALDTGAVAASTWYHVYLIRRPDTGVVDVLVSLSASAPTLPASYTQFRRIGAMKTNASSQWTKFVQIGDLFRWSAPVSDMNGMALSTTPLAVTMTVPIGLTVTAQFNAYANSAATGVNCLFYSPLTDPQATIVPPGNLSLISTINNFAAGQFSIDTNITAQIMAVASNTSSAFGATTGWIDRRGRDN